MATLNRRKDNVFPHRKQGRNFRWVYQSHRWHKLSAQFGKENPLCKRCKDQGITERGEVTDHVIPLVVWVPNGGDPYDASNLQRLSKRCHSIKTIEDKKKYKDQI